MNDCLGIIISTQGIRNQTQSFGSLTTTRPDYMIPFAGRYRIIDFALSTMSNYGLSRVMLHGGKYIRSTLDHIGDGKSWELNRRNNGLFINPANFEVGQEPSTIQAFYDAVDFVEESRSKNVHIMNPMIITKNNLGKAYEEFLRRDDDVMLMYKNVTDREGLYTHMRKLILDENGRLINVGLNLGTNETFPLYIGRMFLKKEVFIDLVKKSVEQGNAMTLMQAVLNYKNKWKVGVYEVESPIMVIKDLNTYYDANMRILRPEAYHELFFENGMVYTKSKDEPSTMYKDTAHVRNSIVANGCVIEGQVENSVIFRGVHVAKNAIVRNSILNEKTYVGPNAVVVNVITDKRAKIMDGVTVAGAYAHPFVIGKKEVVTR